MGQLFKKRRNVQLLQYSSFS